MAHCHKGADVRKSFNPCLRSNNHSLALSKRDFGRRIILWVIDANFLGYMYINPPFAFSKVNYYSYLTPNLLSAY